MSSKELMGNIDIFSRVFVLKTDKIMNIVEWNVLHVRLTKTGSSLVW